MKRVFALPCVFAHRGQEKGEELDIPYDKVCTAKHHIYTDFPTGQ